MFGEHIQKKFAASKALQFCYSPCPPCLAVDLGFARFLQAFRQKPTFRTGKFLLCTSVPDYQEGFRFFYQSEVFPLFSFLPRNF